MKDSTTFFDNQIWLTTNEAAEYLRLTPNAFRIMRCRRNLTLPEYYLGNRLRFKRKDLDMLIQISKEKRRIK